MELLHDLVAVFSESFRVHSASFVICDELVDDREVLMTGEFGECY